MRNLNTQERAAIEAVARQFSTTWEKGSGSPDAYLLIAGKRVAVEITTFKPHGTRQGNAAKPGLRFDKVATRLMERLRATLGETRAGRDDRVAHRHCSYPFGLENRRLAGRQDTNSSEGAIAGSR